MKLSDYIARYLASLAIKKVFVVTGGAVAHMIDSVAARRDIDYICMQHEQSTAMAADAYSRVSGKIGATLSTSGPGATNLFTGICTAYYDSVPALFLTGQVATFRLSKDLKVRQLGFQETNIVDMAKHITKYSILLKDPDMIRYELEKAVYISQTGRPGPVLIDVPDDLQRMEIDPTNLKGFSPGRATTKNEISDSELESKIEQTIKFLSRANRPVMVLGGAIRLAHCEKLALKLVEKLNIPVLVTWAAKDLITYDNPLLAGTFGLTGTRHGNFAVQNSDLVLSIGSRLDTHATGDPKTFARDAKKIVVDIDADELKKFDRFGMAVDIKIQSDVKRFLSLFDSMAADLDLTYPDHWFKVINQWKKRFKLIDDKEKNSSEGIYSPYFIEKLSDSLGENDIIITDTGCSLVNVCNIMRIKKGQRIFSSFNNTPMGYSLPASIGAFYANDKASQVISISGDGGFQMNIQELATIAKHQLPIKMIVFNNNGYGMIRATQEQWLDGKYHAACGDLGIPEPDFEAIAKAYGINALTISSHQDMDDKLEKAIQAKTPYLINLKLRFEHDLMTTKFGRPIEDMEPLLDRDTFKKNMIVKPLEVSES